MNVFQKYILKQDVIIFDDFCMGGQLLLWASRHWMKAFRKQKVIAPCVWQSFAVPGLSSVYTELCELLRIMSFRELRADKFNRPDAIKLSAPEVLFMTILSKVQAGDLSGAINDLECIAPPAVAREIVERSSRIVFALQQAGHRVYHAIETEVDEAGNKNEQQFNVISSATIH